MNKRQKYLLLFDKLSKLDGFFALAQMIAQRPMVELTLAYWHNELDPEQQYTLFKALQCRLPLLDAPTCLLSLPISSREALFKYADEQDIDYIYLAGEVYQRSKDTPQYYQRWSPRQPVGFR